MLEDVLTRLWQDLIMRPAGPLQLRFILQPAMAICLAVRSGLQDSRDGKPAFFWALFVDPQERVALLRDGWKSIGKIFNVALALDCIYQIIVFHWIYPLEAVVVATFLALIPYLLVRGPVNRIARTRKLGARKTAAGQV